MVQFTEVNRRIRQVRQALSLSQTDFSRAICVSNGYTAEIENEHRAANGRISRLVCLTFGVNETWLKTGEGEMFQRSPAAKQERLLSLFSGLDPQFQDYTLTVIGHLLKLQEEHLTGSFSHNHKD
jgi:transcriptional regulator with XRE-family HTH domain